MMTETVARTGLAKAGLLKYKPLPKLEELAHGIVPHEYAVLVLQRELEGRSIGNILIPESSAEREQDAAVDGLLVAVSPAAFGFDPLAPRPEPGALVVFRRYAGFIITGDDGLKYRLMSDKDIIAVRRTEKLEVESAW